MILLAGADLVLPDRVISSGSLVIDNDRILSVESGAGGTAAERYDLSDHYVLPGFIDVHIHGICGHDALQGLDALRAMAGALPRFGATAFCPTSVACDPATLTRFLEAVGTLRARPADGARVLPAHLESNFISLQYAGAQPVDCLRLPPTASPPAPREGDFSAEDILQVMAGFAADIGIVSLAPELPGAVDLIRRVTVAGHLASLGHSGASFEEAQEAIRAGARQATHLFNRMGPAHHRSPGLAGAMLASDDIAVEIIGDGLHVHPAMVRTAVAAKQPSRVMAVTDASAVAGLAAGARASLGRQTVTSRAGVSWLDDGTMAGGAVTMDGVFGVMVGEVGLSLVDAAHVCSTTPAREMRLTGLGVIAPGAVADLVVLDRHFRVRHTFVAGRCVYSA